jgi:hypothetical protein
MAKKYKTKKFKKEDLQNLVWEDITEGFEVIRDTIEENTRWAILHSMIFKYEDKYYETSYRVGATEQQDERPYEWEDDEIDCYEKVQAEKTVVIYNPVYE